MIVECVWTEAHAAELERRIAHLALLEASAEGPERDVLALLHGAARGQRRTVGETILVLTYW